MIRTVKLQMNETTFHGLISKRYSITIPTHFIKELRLRKGMTLRMGIVNKFIKIGK